MNWAYDIISSIREGSLLGFRKHTFCDPASLLRQNNRIFPGSFNPIHNAHLPIGKGAIYEICVSNFYKGLASPEDLFHRITMLSMCDIPVLLSLSRTYTEKDNLFRRCVDQNYVYPIGADAWNRCIKSAGMFDGLDTSGSKFEVYPYPDEIVDHFPIPYEIVHVDRPVIRSSDIRLHNGLLNEQILPSRVVSYIESNGLYS